MNKVYNVGGRVSHNDAQLYIKALALLKQNKKSNMSVQSNILAIIST